MNDALLVNVRGRVQGVGFRYFTRQRAQQLQLTGYVKNLADGSVEAYAEGPPEHLEQFLTEIHRGPVASSVQNVDTHWRTAKGNYKDFQITF